jgi:hypothetical protein
LCVWIASGAVILAIDAQAARRGDQLLGWRRQGKRLEAIVNVLSKAVELIQARG